MEMDVPNQYPYNPRLGTILWLFAGGFMAMGLAWLAIGGPLGVGPYYPWFNFFYFGSFGVVVVAWAIILSVRWIWFERYLLLDNDSIVLPIGLLKIQTAKIEYTSIRHVYRHCTSRYGHLVLHVETEKQTFKILPDFLPDKESCSAMEEFLKRKALENRSGKVPSRASAAASLSVSTASNP
jgi:hypothetical protein